MNQEIVPESSESLSMPISTPAKQIISQRLEVSQYNGPLPNPEIVARYDEVLPGSAERTFRMVESEQEHRHKMQARQLEAEIADQKEVRNIEKTGQIFALIFSVVAMGVSGVTALNGKELTASIFGVGGMGSLVVAFIQGRQKAKDTER